MYLLNQNTTEGASPWKPKLWELSTGLFNSGNVDRTGNSMISGKLLLGVLWSMVEDGRCCTISLRDSLSQCMCPLMKYPKIPLMFTLRVIHRLDLKCNHSNEFSLQTPINGVLTVDLWKFSGQKPIAAWNTSFSVNPLTDKQIWTGSISQVTLLFECLNSSS